MCVCLFYVVFSLACLCFDSSKGPTVPCLVWKLSCHHHDPVKYTDSLNDAAIYMQIGLVCMQLFIYFKF